MPSLPEILVKALEDFLDKRDPLRKAERAKAHAENSPSSEKEASAEVETEAEGEAVSDLASPGNGDHSEDNLTLRCRRHNQAAAEQEIGTGFMKSADQGSRETSPKEFQRLVETSNGTKSLINVRRHPEH